MTGKRDLLFEHKTTSQYPKSLADLSRKADAFITQLDAIYIGSTRGFSSGSGQGKDEVLSLLKKASAEMEMTKTKDSFKALGLIYITQKNLALDLDIKAEEELDTKLEKIRTIAHAITKLLHVDRDEYKNLHTRSFYPVLDDSKTLATALENNINILFPKPTATRGYVPPLTPTPGDEPPPTRPR